MYIEHLALTDFRSYQNLDLELSPGVTVFVGPNGVGKTNIVEAIGYLASLSSHRVSTDKPLVGFEAERALVRGRFVKGMQKTVVELEINPAAPNRVRINRANPVRARAAQGILKTVLFAPEDLILVKGEPSSRRRYLDDLIISMTPHQAGIAADYDRVLKQRNALLKSVRVSGRFSDAHAATLDVWNHHLISRGSLLVQARIALIGQLRPYFQQAYQELTDRSKDAALNYRTTIHGWEADEGHQSPRPFPAENFLDLTLEKIQESFEAMLGTRRKQELDRGVSLVGPHRDDLEMVLGKVPAKGYASHGETWSLALALRLAAFYLFLDADQSESSSPVLILDDVFAELDVQRRQKLARIVAGAEQVLVTAAVVADIPDSLGGRQILISPGGYEETDAGEED